MENAYTNSSLVTENFNALQNNDHLKEQSQEKNKPYDSQENDTEDSLEDDTEDSLEDDTEDSQEDDTEDSLEDNTEDSQEDDTEDSLEDDTNDSQFAEPNIKCNKKDISDILCGTHEIQESEGEADLHKHYFGCKKNPGHTKFVPVNDFKINHLPKGYHDNLLVEYIKAIADLTVRVAVTMTSTERPEFWPNTKKQYPFYDKRGSDVMKVGTGKVRNLKIKYNKGLCPCHKCQNSDTPSIVWGKVRMWTATHVVFDDLEARHTTCRLFYDGQDSPLVTLDGWTVVDADIEEDWCELKCVTCDVDLLERLEKMWIHWWDLWEKVNKKYKRSGNKLIFIVSHPHGCPKQISVGHWIHRYEVSDDKIKYTYTTCTCPGSSGAYVHTLGYHFCWLYDRHVHIGVNSKGRNFSGVSVDFKLISTM